MKKFRLFSLVIIAALLAACDLSLAGDITPPPDYQAPTFEAVADEAGYPEALPDAASGRLIYQQSCLPCHGADGLGDGPQAAQLPVTVPAIGSAEVAFQSTPAEWFQVITQGNMENFMPPFAGSYSAQQRWDVLAYVYSLASDPALIEQGQGVFRQVCAECHGLDGGGSEAARDFSDQQLMAETSGADILQLLSSAEPPHDFSVNAEDAWAVAAYVRGFTFPVIDTGSMAEPTEAVTPAATSEAGETGETNEEGAVEETPETPTLTVSGVVNNGSDSSLPDDLMLTLRAFDHFEPALEMSGTVEADGGFSFEDLEPVAGRLYFVTVEHQGATYASQFVTLEEGQTEISLEATYYDSTHDPSALVADRVHMFFDFNDPEMVQVVQFWVISNPTQQAVTPQDGSVPVLQFPLPQGFSGLAFESGELGQQYLPTADGFGDLRMVEPGEGIYQMLFAFQLPYKRSLDYAQTLEFPAGVVQVFVPQGIKLEGEGLQSSGMQDLNGEPYDSYEVEDTGAGYSLSFSLKGRNPAAESIFAGVGQQGNLVIGTAGLLLVVLGVVLWLRQVRTPEELPGTSEAVMDAIIELDAAYEAGALDEAEYQAQRQALKNRLAELTGKE